MRTALLANNRLGARVARWLADRGDLVALVLHQVERQRSVEHLGEELSVPTWSYPDGLDDLKRMAPDCLLSVLFGHVVPTEWLAIPAWMPLNLHPGLLPYNAGANPNVWPLVDGTPAGTTLHVMSETVDAGAIVAQRRVPVSPADTAETLYRRLEEASFDMLTECWGTIRTITPVPQPAGGTFHRSAELRDLDPLPTDLPVIDRLRARTFPPFGAEFDRDGRRWRIRVEIDEVT